MSIALDSQKLAVVFQSRPDIIDGIKLAADTPGRIALFNEIIGHINSQQESIGEPASKRRKVDPSQSTPNANGAYQQAAGSGNAADEPILLHVKEISVSVPQRKKLELCLTQNFIYARAAGTTAPIPAITYAWKDIEYAFYLPVPEKTQVQHNYVLFPRGTSLPSKTNPPTIEPLVFTVPATAPKEGTIAGAEASAAASVSDTYKSLFHWAFERRLRSAGNGIDLISADPNKFHSVVRQPHRPNEKALHVSGFRGSKDGYLFFLENGILWGFKKPLIFIPLSRIAAISYTNILQITFNMVVEVFAADDGEPNDDLEFGMLDQQDYGGIDDYVKRNGLQDRSMAEQRKAKLQLAENRALKKGSEDAQEGDGAHDNGKTHDDMTELERAQAEAEQQLQDDEDEDEEDYDPGSEGDSEGSGDSSDEDGGDGDEGEGGASDGEEDDEEEYDEEEEEEEEVDEHEEEEAKDHIKSEPEPQPVVPKKTAPSVKKAATQVPVRQGWAAMGSSRPAEDVDMEEKFDVV